MKNAIQSVLMCKKSLIELDEEDFITFLLKSTNYLVEEEFKVKIDALHFDTVNFGLAQSHAHMCAMVMACNLHMICTLR